MKHSIFFVLLILYLNTAIGETNPGSSRVYLETLAETHLIDTPGRATGSRPVNEDSIDTKVTFSSGSNSLDFVPMSSFNNGLLIQPANKITNNSIPATFYSGPGGSWSFYTNGVRRLNLDSDGYIKTSNTSLLINGATPEASYSMKVHGNAGFDSSISLGEVSDSTSFISLNLGFKSTYGEIDDKKSPYSSTPTLWAAGKNLPVFRLRHPSNVAQAGRSSNTSTAKDFMILPYQYGMAIDYNGVVECWVGEWSIHKGDFYNDTEGQGNGWGGILWVGDDRDQGGVRATARNSVSNSNVNYGELSVEKFFGTPNGDFRLRLPSTNNQFHFVYGGRGSTNIVAKVSDKGFFIPKVSSSSAILIPEKGQVYFDSTAAEFKGYDGTGWVSLSDNLITGTTVLTSGGISTFYQIPHGLGLTPTYFNVMATSADAGNISYVTADNNFLKIYYSTTPPAGINNLSWNWQVRK